eukprot:851381-Alexandrium_andersonii.AAC.1
MRAPAPDPSPAWARMRSNVLRSAGRDASEGGQPAPSAPVPQSPLPPSSRRAPYFARRCFHA